MLLEESGEGLCAQRASKLCDQRKFPFFLAPILACFLPRKPQFSSLGMKPQRALRDDIAKIHLSVSISKLKNHSNAYPHQRTEWIWTNAHFLSLTRDPSYSNGNEPCFLTNPHSLAMASCFLTVPGPPVFSLVLWLAGPSVGTLEGLI